MFETISRHFSFWTLIFAIIMFNERGEIMRLLVCDDDCYDLNKTMSLLMDCVYTDGCSIRGFHEPCALVNYFEDGNEADVLFLDIVMPEMNGITLAKKIRAMGYDSFIIFLSSLNDYAAQSYEVKAFSYLLKPPVKSDIQAILKKIEKALTGVKRSGIKLAHKNGGRFVSFKDLVYVEVRDHYLYFNLNSGEVIQIRSNLSVCSAALLADTHLAQCNMEQHGAEL